MKCNTHKIRVAYLALVVFFGMAVFISANQNLSYDLRKVIWKTQFSTEVIELHIDCLIKSDKFYGVKIVRKKILDNKGNEQFQSEIHIPSDHLKDLRKIQLLTLTIYKNGKNSFYMDIKFGNLNKKTGFYPYARFIVENGVYVKRMISTPQNEGPPIYKYTERGP